VPGKNEREAVEQFIGFIRETLHCITTAPLKAFQWSDNLYILFFDPSAPIVAKNGTKFYLSVTQTFTVEQREDGSYKVRTREYSYVFATDQESTTHGRIAYHWHPNDFNLRDPHLHISITPQLGYPDIEQRISRAHFPTSRVCLEDFVVLLIKYYDIRPQLPEAQWKRIIKKNKAAFGAGATWFVQQPPVKKKSKKRSASKKSHSSK
jgi:hypothetical protein